MWTDARLYKEVTHLYDHREKSKGVKEKWERIKERKKERQRDCPFICLEMKQVKWMNDWMTEWMNEWPALGWRPLHCEAIHLTTLTGYLVNQSINCSFSSVINDKMKESKSGLFVRWNGTKLPKCRWFSLVKACVSPFSSWKLPFKSTIQVYHSTCSSERKRKKNRERVADSLGRFLTAR